MKTGKGVAAEMPSTISLGNTVVGAVENKMLEGADKTTKQIYQVAKTGVKIGIEATKIGVEVGVAVATGGASAAVSVAKRVAVDTAIAGVQMAVSAAANAAKNEIMKEVPPDVKQALGAAKTVTAAASTMKTGIKAGCEVGSLATKGVSTLNTGMTRVQAAQAFLPKTPSGPPVRTKPCGIGKALAEFHRQRQEALKEKTPTVPLKNKGDRAI